MSGWFAIKRGAHDHAIFKKNPERFFVWTWMIATAAWKPTRMDAGGKIVDVNRGQLLTSYRQMSDATGVGIQIIRTLITRLQRENAIDTETNTGRMLITIRNYDKYQSGDGSPNTAANTEATQHQHTKEQGNNSDYVGRAENAPPVDPVKVMFDSGIQLLGEAGKNKTQARALIGKWRKHSSDEAVMAALSRAQRAGEIEPVSFIEGALKFSAKKAEPQPGDTRTLKTGEKQIYANPFDGWVKDYG